MRHFIAHAGRPTHKQLRNLVSSHGGTPATVCDFGDELHVSSREREADTWGHPRVFVRWRESRGQIEVEA